MRQEFSFVGGHIHVNGTFTFAAFARQTQVERLAYFFRLPAMMQGVALQELEEQSRATPTTGSSLVGPGSV